MLALSRRLLPSVLLAASVLSAVVTVAARPTLQAVEHLTIPVPAALPHVTLVPGEYTFQVNHLDSGDVVQVWQRQSERLIYQGFTTGVERPRRIERSLAFGEAPDGQATPIVAWYPSRHSRGYRFLYPEN